MKPFLKWPGGKRRLLPQLREVTPSTYGRYFEGFVGAGAMLFDLQPPTAVVSDVNRELITSYQVIRDSVDSLIKALEHHAHQNSREYFLSVRAWDRDPVLWRELSDIDIAARMIYLNRTCFNGLYRVNSHNQFNTPYGKYANPLIVDRQNLVSLSQWMGTVDLTFSTRGYQETLTSSVAVGDFVYLDPPYIPLSATSSFVGYSSSGFGLEEQRELASFAQDLDEMGAYVLLSNADTPLTHELYSNFDLRSVDVMRSVGAHSETRQSAPELLIVGRSLKKVL